MDQLHREKNEAIQSIKADYEFQVKTLKHDLAKLHDVHAFHSSMNTRISDLELSMLWSFTCILALGVGIGTIILTSKPCVSYG
jgi:hypothetical protein